MKLSSNIFSFRAPLAHMIPVSSNSEYSGEYLNVLSSKEVEIADTCVEDRASFVECPPLVCGMRVKLRNPYRREEVESSVEDGLLRSTLTESSSSNKTEDVVGSERVVGGKASQPGAWPWVATIYRNGIFLCGCVLINPEWIVTAAHCTTKYWHFYYEVHLGVLRRYSYSPIVQVRVVSHVITHHAYDHANLKNDIALMKLAMPVKFNRYVRPICLPSENTAGKFFMEGPPPGTSCTVVGWGATTQRMDGSDRNAFQET